MTETWKRRLRTAIDDSGLSMKEVSLKADKGETFVRDVFERGRVPSIENFIAIARVLGKSAAYLLGEDVDVNAYHGLRRIEVRGFVQAGHFAESWEWDESERYAAFVPDAPEFRRVELFGGEIKGPSMNRRYKDGTVVVFARLVDTREKPAVGKRYLIERMRQTGEVEHTVKLLYEDANKKLWLMPESDDPRFQAPISLEEGTQDGDTITIVGRVVYAIIQE